MSYTDSPLIELDGLTKGFGGNEVIKGLDLTLPPGIHALLGPNGAGKTTLVNILSTLTPADSGTARVLGLDVRRDKRRIQRLISLTGQYAAVDERLTGIENLHMMGRLFGLSRRDTAARAAGLLDRFELAAAAGRRVSGYSGGMRRKLDIAVGLIARPRLLFLDEPTTGLDTRSRQTLWDEITALAGDGTSIFLTTQYLEEADVLADRIMVLNGGRVVADGTASQLKERVGGSTIRLHDGQGRVTEEIATRGTALEISRHLAALAAERPDVRVTVRRPTLDEVFLQLTGKQAS
ncbi:ATP-binding cassette domain-containing protein [Actinomadura livida]|uniref:ABC-2 type transport system ATP-binding protein n=1 Tax=Actinomadura livida TaxID=79909 RepID=A0A7W7IJG6_9ACTN|nr:MULTISPECIES: ATP-binding cassette domain-containing protein [Actinomadura]MBB4778096.1 ABC-2 type transport system ATP-binding protein [Actinomadura catellatispora]GGU28764.1 daunorubicin resistance protein DrrA family ABC transporter ATP-binding protein [Actinomadura livida]